MYRSLNLGGKVHTARDVDAMSESEFMELVANIMWQRGGVVGADRVVDAFKKHVLDELQHSDGKTIQCDYTKISAELQPADEREKSKKLGYADMNEFVRRHWILLRLVRGLYDGFIDEHSAQTLCDVLRATHEEAGDVIRYLSLDAIADGQFMLNLSKQSFVTDNTVHWEKKSRDGKCVYSMNVHYTYIATAHAQAAIFVCALGCDMDSDVVQLMLDRYEEWWWDVISEC